MPVRQKHAPVKIIQVGRGLKRGFSRMLDSHELGRNWLAFLYQCGSFVRLSVLEGLIGLVIDLRKLECSCRVRVELELGGPRTR